MKKYPILIALIGFMGISITRVYSLTVPPKSFDIESIKTRVTANSTFYYSIKKQFDKLVERYNTLIKQYTSATSAEARKELVDDINQVKIDIRRLTGFES